MNDQKNTLLLIVFFIVVGLVVYALNFFSIVNFSTKQLLEKIEFVLIVTLVLGLPIYFLGLLFSNNDSVSAINNNLETEFYSRDVMAKAYHISTKVQAGHYPLEREVYWIFDIYSKNNFKPPMPHIQPKIMIEIARGFVLSAGSIYNIEKMKFFLEKYVRIPEIHAQIIEADSLRDSFIKLFVMIFSQFKQHESIYLVREAEDLFILLGETPADAQKLVKRIFPNENKHKSPYEELFKKDL